MAGYLWGICHAGFVVLVSATLWHGLAEIGIGCEGWSIGEEIMTKYMDYPDQITIYMSQETGIRGREEESFGWWDNLIHSNVMIVRD